MMKNIFVLLLVFVVYCGAAIVPLMPPVKKMDDLEYYSISTPQELAWFALSVNSGNGSINGLLNADIILNTSEGNPWTPIGSNEGSAFHGIFDGANHSISGLYVEGEYAGTFGIVGENGIVVNLKIKNSTFIGDNGFAGGVAAKNLGRIENCDVDASIGQVQTNVYDIYYRVYTLEEDLSFSQVNELLNQSGLSVLGGVVGENSGNVSYCVFRGENLPTVFSMGGIVGTNKGGNVDRCTNYANIIVKGDFDKTIVDNRDLGYSFSLVVNYAFDYSAGGIVGLSESGYVGENNLAGSVSNNMNYGNIVIETKACFTGMMAHAGGIAAEVAQSSNIGRSVNKGNVSVYMSCSQDVSELVVGGVVGEQNGSLVYCANLGNVSAYKQPDNAGSCQAFVGGVAGVNGGNSSVSYSAAKELLSNCNSSIYATVSGASSDMNLFYNADASVVDMANPDNGISQELFGSSSFLKRLNDASILLSWNVENGFASPISDLPYENIYSLSKQDNQDRDVLSINHVVRDVANRKASGRQVYFNMRGEVVKPSPGKKWQFRTLRKLLR